MQKTTTATNLIDIQNELNRLIDNLKIKNLLGEIDNPNDEIFEGTFITESGDKYDFQIDLQSKRLITLAYTHFVVETGDFFELTVNRAKEEFLKYYDSCYDTDTFDSFDEAFDDAFNDFMSDNNCADLDLKESDLEFYLEALNTCWQLADIR
ncbi:MAG: hypothetical protein ACRC8K_14420 [Waterburya sp.]